MSDALAWVEVMNDLVDTDYRRFPRTAGAAPQPAAPSPARSEEWEAAFGKSGIRPTRKPAKVFQGVEGMKALDTMIRFNSRRRRRKGG